MKKVLSVLSLIAILGMSTPAFADGHRHGNGHGYGHGGQIVHAGHGYYRPHHGGHHVAPPPRGHYHRGSAVIGGVLARRSHWGYRDCYYNRLGWCDDFYYSPGYYGGSGVYVNFGIPIRF